jgi:hypothetical protein
MIEKEAGLEPLSNEDELKNYLEQILRERKEGQPSSL